MAKSIKNVAITVFIVAVVVLTLIGVLSIWDVLAKDTLYKSVTTMALIGFAALIVAGSAKFIETRQGSTPPSV